MCDAQVTTDHYTIRRWVEERGGSPSTVEGSGNGDGAGMLRIEFPGHGEEEKLRQIPWGEFFEKFDRANLAFLYQSEHSEVDSGEVSRFCKFIDRAHARDRA